MEYNLQSDQMDCKYPTDLIYEEKLSKNFDLYIFERKFVVTLRLLKYEKYDSKNIRRIIVL